MHANYKRTAIAGDPVTRVCSMKVRLGVHTVLRRFGVCWELGIDGAGLFPGNCDRQLIKLLLVVGNGIISLVTWEQTNADSVI